ncbi:MAG: YfdX family protein [Terriglobales bacterium]
MRETENAISNITDNKTDEAVAAIQRASSKLDSVLSSNPASALITVDAQATVFETPLHDTATINDIAQDAGRAFDDRDFPAARVLLNALRSEIRVRTVNPPLGTYPTALKNAIRLLQQKKAPEAKAVLLAVLDTLVLVDRIIPLPLLLAREAVNEAQTLREKDKDTAMKRLGIAREELQRSRALGYAGKDPEYNKLLDVILTLEKQLRGNEGSTSAFAALKERLGRFLKRQSDREQRQP